MYNGRSGYKRSCLDTREKRSEADAYAALQNRGERTKVELGNVYRKTRSAEARSNDGHIAHEDGMAPGSQFAVVGFLVGEFSRL